MPGTVCTLGGLGSKLTLVLVPEEQELSEYRLTEPDGGLVEPAWESLPGRASKSYGNGVKGSEWG